MEIVSTNIEIHAMKERLRAVEVFDAYTRLKNKYRKHISVVSRSEHDINTILRFARLSKRRRSYEDVNWMSNEHKCMKLELQAVSCPIDLRKKL